ncbi:CASP8-associated protein 2 isoform X2 [Salarias fasciatus]|uniref:CASP8-associated protein 2 isoform X2 n=1 Tax=Salarias fasciatus TaxID=181472 RepID=UPI0011767019|nr:CASP8-associated protein 2 isoform X2 [Salarias fasciatus]
MDRTCAPPGASEDSVDIYDGLDVGVSGCAESPRVAARLRESMDLYEELVTEEERCKEASYAELKSRFEAAQSQIEELRARLEQMETQNSGLTSENCCLKKNLSSLLQTARQEVKRKDAEILRLSQRSQKSHYHPQPRFSLQDPHQSQRASTVTSSSKPPPPPPGPAPAAPPLPPRPPGDPAQTCRREGTETTGAPKPSSHAPPRRDCEAADRLTPRCREDKQSEKDSETPARRPRGASERPGPASEQIRSHRAEGRRQGEVSDGETKTSSPDASHRSQSDKKASSSSRERRHDKSRSESDRGAPRGSKDVHSREREERTSRTGDKHRRGSRHAERHSDPAKERKDPRDRNHQRREDRRREDDGQQRPKLDSQTESGRERDKRRNKEDKREKTVKTFPRESADGRKPGGEENSPSRKLCFMETLNLTLSPIKKPAPASGGGQEAEGGRTPDGDGDPPRLEDMCVIDEADVSESEAGLAEASNSALNGQEGGLGPRRSPDTAEPEVPVLPGPEPQDSPSCQGGRGLQHHQDQVRTDSESRADGAESEDGDPTESGQRTSRKLQSADCGESSGPPAAVEDPMVLRPGPVPQSSSQDSPRQLAVPPPPAEGSAAEDTSLRTSPDQEARSPAPPQDSPQKPCPPPAPPQDSPQKPCPPPVPPQDSPQKPCPPPVPPQDSPQKPCPPPVPPQDSPVEPRPPPVPPQDAPEEPRPPPVPPQDSPQKPCPPPVPPQDAPEEPRPPPVPPQDAPQKPCPPPVPPQDAPQKPCPPPVPPQDAPQKPCPPPVPPQDAPQKPCPPPVPPQDAPQEPHPPALEDQSSNRLDSSQNAAAVPGTLSLDSLPQDGLSLSEAILALAQEDSGESPAEPGSSAGRVGPPRGVGVSEEKLPERLSRLNVTPKKSFSPGKRQEASGSGPFLHDEDSMMRTLNGLKRIPDAISPLRSPVHGAKRTLSHLHGKPGHVKSLQKEFSGPPLDASSKKLDVNKENKYPGSPANRDAPNLPDKASDPSSGLSDTELEEGEIVSEPDEAPAGSPAPAAKRAKLAPPVKSKASPKSVLKRTRDERASKESRDTAAGSTPSPKSRFKTVRPAATKASFSTIDDIMETFKLVRTEIRKKYMKLHKTFPKKSFYGVMDNFQESFVDFVDGAQFGAICSHSADLKSKLKKLITSVFSKVSNNGIVKRIFEQQAVDMKQKLWDFVDAQVNYLFREIDATLQGLCRPSQSNDKRPGRQDKPPRSPTRKPHCQQTEAPCAAFSLNPARPCTYKKGLGSRGKDIRITEREGKAESNPPNDAAEFLPPKKLSTPEKSRSVAVSQNGLLVDKTDFQLLTEQQASSLTFNLVRDSQMGEIFKCLLQGSDLLESGGDNGAWTLASPRKDGERFVSVATPTKFDSPSKLFSPTKLDTPTKLVAAWASISPRRLSSPRLKDPVHLNPALFDESCMLELPSDTAVQPQKSFSILTEDLAVSLTIPSPLKSDSHLSFLQPSGAGMHLVSTPDSVISAHISEDALMDGEDATEQDIHLALDTDNSSCDPSSSSGASSPLATPFVFNPDKPMQALVMEKSNDHFIVKIRQANGGIPQTDEDSLDRTITEEAQHEEQDVTALESREHQEHDGTALESQRHQERDGMALESREHQEHDGTALESREHQEHDGTALESREHQEHDGTALESQEHKEHDGMALESQRHQEHDGTALESQTNTGVIERSHEDSCSGSTVPSEPSISNFPERSANSQTTAKLNATLTHKERRKLMKETIHKRERSSQSSSRNCSPDPSVAKLPDGGLDDSLDTSRQNSDCTVIAEESREGLGREDIPPECPSEVLSDEPQKTVGSSTGSGPDVQNHLRDSDCDQQVQTGASLTSDPKRDETDVSESERCLAIAEDSSSSPQKPQTNHNKSRKRKKHQKKSKAKRSKDEESRKDKESPSSLASLSPNSLSAKNVVRKKGEVVIAWTRDEDRAILIALKTEGASRETFSALSERLHKPSEQVAHRFHQLMKLFRKMDS